MAQVKLDSGYSWVILASAFLYNLIEAGVFMAPIVYMIDWLDMYNATKAQVGLVGSLMQGMTYITGLFVGPLVDRYGCRTVSFVGITLAAIGSFSSAFAPTIYWLYFTYGIVLGIGEGFLYFPPVLLVQYYFDKKRPFAGGISSMGHSLGTFSMIPLLRFLIQTFGIQRTLILHTGIILQCFVLASLFRPINVKAIPENSPNTKSEVTTLQENNTLKSTSEKCTSWIKTLWDFSLFKNIPYVLFIVAECLGEYGVAVLYKFTSIKAVYDNVPVMKVALLTSVTSLVSTTMRIPTSIIANLPYVNRILLCGSSILFQGIVVMVSCIAWNFTTYSIFMAIFGLGLGVHNTIVTTVLTDIVGVSKLAQATSFEHVFRGVAMLSSLPLAGWIVDTTDNYDISYYVFGAIGCIAGIIMLIIPLIQRKVAVKSTIVKSCEDNQMQQMENLKKEALPPMHISAET